jgi:hypothetical protein
MCKTNWKQRGSKESGRYMDRITIYISLDRMQQSWKEHLVSGKVKVLTSEYKKGLWFRTKKNKYLMQYGKIQKE